MSRSRIIFRFRDEWRLLQNGKGFHDDLEMLVRDRRHNGHAFAEERVIRLPRRRKYRTHPQCVGLRFW